MTIEQRIDSLLNSELQTIRYHLVSACLNRFIPTMPESTYVEFYRSVLQNQMYAWEDQLYVDPVANSQIIGEQYILNTPSIFCSFHISSYRMGLKYLATRGFPISLVVSDDVLKSQRDIIQQVFSSASGGRPIGLIDANSPQSLLTMIRALQSGQSLFVYIDGNTGSDGMSSTNPNLVEQSLLNSSLFVRKGVPVLSHISGAPIIPLMTCRESQTFKMTFFRPILPDAGMSRDQYIRNSLQTLYGILEQQLRVSPESWEAWLYIYKFVLPPTEDVGKDDELCMDLLHSNSYKFNDQRYRFYERIGTGDKYVFDKKMLQVYPVDADLWDILHGNSVCVEDVPQHIFQQLIQKKIIL